ncbi:retinol dehydrogenase 11-like [Eriocheir sinensis]|uniref:retinol dehydrogenase 11-like n=1 Tax=Eriocheir sinensis TaxID=95602 RepID=UPI0021CA6524|nr:retinol dehydrogenase 11-like [Eriocheir sinensis]
MELSFNTMVLTRIVAVVKMVLRMVLEGAARRCTSKRSLAGMTAIVTGASAGIGKETAKDLARRGARVILACRNRTKALAVAEHIISETGNKEVVVRVLDTADLASVRHFAKEVLRTEGAIHILVNNAGTAGKDVREVTRDGLELTMATNHYGHFLLTNLLLKRLRQSAPSRIINVSSVAHFLALSIDMKDLNFEKMNYGTMTAYGQSKLCNILFTIELANKLRGSGVTANALHPGAVSTEIIARRENAATWWRWIFLQIGDIMIYLFGKDSQLGAQTTIHLAVSEELEGISGKYFSECKEAPTSQLARDPILARSLWKISEADVQLLPSEIFY